MIYQRLLRDGNENGQKAIGLYRQNNNSARASRRFFVQFFAVVARLQRKTSLISRSRSDT